jgi:hypothetical protein
MNYERSNSHIRRKRGERQLSVITPNLLQNFFGTQGEEYFFKLSPR